MIKWSLEWPFDTFYNCYWGSVTLYDNYYTHEFPHWLNWKNKSDGSYVRYGTYGELWNNIAFNFGFMFMDFVQLLISWGYNYETQYDWYKIGFISGDLYTRIFFRSLQSVPVK